MKHIKTFENSKNTPEVGDYILANYDSIFDSLKDLVDFMNNTIGVVANITSFNPYVKYDNVPINLKKYFNRNGSKGIVDVSLDHILYFSKSKEEIEMKLNKNKFNI